MARSKTAQQIRRMEDEKNKFIEEMVAVLRTQPWFILRLISSTLNHIKV